MMTVLGTVKGGVVVLEPRPGQELLAEGAQVVVSLAGPHAWMLKLAGTVDLPPDFAYQHDHHPHGTPEHPTPTDDDWNPDPEGIAILREIVERSRPINPTDAGPRDEVEPASGTLAELFKLAGLTPNTPADSAAEHGPYRFGNPKR